MYVPRRIEVAILLAVAMAAWLVIRSRGASLFDSVEDRPADSIRVESPVAVGTPPTQLGSDPLRTDVPPEGMAPAPLGTSPTPRGSDPQRIDAPPDGEAPTVPVLGVGPDGRTTAVEGDEATAWVQPATIAALQDLAPKEAADVRFVAEVHVTARDAPDGAEALRYDVWVSTSGQGAGFSGRQGRLDLAVSGGAKAVDLTVDLSARGFASVRRTVHLNETRPRVRLDVELERVAMGSVAVRANSPPVGLLDRPFCVEVWDVLTKRRISRERVPSAVEGVWRFDLPDGRHRLRLRPDDASISHVAFDADVVVVAGRTTECDWAVPPSGSLRLVALPTWRTVEVLVTPVEGGTASRVTAGGVHHHVPVGPYRVTSLDDPTGAGLVVTVVAGETAEPNLGTR